eukprot:XP_006577505.2 uncharacterized protein LOC102659745 [Glycine max]
MKNKKNGPQHRGKSYLNPPKQYGNRPNNQKTITMGFAGGSGIKPNTFPTHIICYKCRKPGHISLNCPDKDMICFNCGQKGHTQRDCSQLKKEQNGGGPNGQTGHPKATGRVFSLNGAEALKSKDLIQEKLKLSVSSLHKDLVVETPTSGFVGSKDMMFTSVNQVVTSLKEDAQVYMILSNLAIETKASMGDLLVVREFPEVFPRDISGLPPERERDRVFHRSGTWCWTHIHSPL